MADWRPLFVPCDCDDCKQPAGETTDQAQRRREAGLKNHLGTKNRRYVLRLAVQRAQRAQRTRGA